MLQDALFGMSTFFTARRPFRNIPTFLTKGNSPYFKLTSIALCSFETSFKTFDSFNIHLYACIPAFHHKSDNTLYSFIAPSLVLTESILSSIKVEHKTVLAAKGY